MKETIVFVHGAWHGKWCWEESWTKIFTKAGYNCITFDLPGHNTPGKVVGINSITIKDYVDALEDIVAKLDRPPIILGHSMGGLVVQKYLERAPCKKAVLLASVPPYGVINTTIYFLKKLSSYPALLLFDLYRLVDTEEKSREAFFSESLDGQKLTLYTSKLCSESYRAFLKMLVPNIRLKHHQETPTLVIGAADDKIFSIKENEATAKKYNADLIIIEDIAHDMMLDTGQDHVASVIIDWLSKGNR